MRLVLQLVGPPRLMGAAQRYELRAGSLSVGRSPEADWTISDTDRLISRIHMRVDASHGDFVLTDTSSNGVYVNGSAEPVGYGASVGLRDGDRIRIGEAEIVATVEAGAPQPAGGETPAASPFVLNAQTFAESIAAPPVNDPFGGPFGRAGAAPPAPAARVVVGADWMNEPVAAPAPPFRSPPDRGDAVVLPLRSPAPPPAEPELDAPNGPRRGTVDAGLGGGGVSALVEAHPELSAQRLAAILDAAAHGVDPQTWNELFMKIKSVVHNDAK